MNHTPHAQQSTHQGFTLVEVLVSLTIFAVLAAAAWQVFGQLELTKERVGAQANKLSALQNAHRQIQNDLLQASNRAVLTQSSQQPALSLSLNRLSFSKYAVADPRVDAAPVLERIVYALEGETLVRSSQKNMQDKTTQGLKAKLLDGVTGLKITALDPGSSPDWPPQELADAPQNPSQNSSQGSQAALPKRLTTFPMGVSVAFNYTGQDIVWRFLMPPNAPKIEQKLPKTNDQKSGKNGGKNKEKDSKREEDGYPEADD